MVQKKKIILLSGPTASGKSKLAIKLAQHYKGEIVNADSMQIYKEISILTSRPSLNDTEIIKHHLYGFHSVKKKFSTGLWLNLVIEKIEEIWNKNLTPIIVGGTGLYFKALTEGLVKIPNIPDEIIKDTRKLHKKLGQKLFFTKLIELDPLAKKFVLPNDAQRSMRVYDVKKFTNSSLFQLIKKTKSKFNKDLFIKLFISPSKEFLHEKISKRTEEMFRDGAVNEVKSFFKMRVYRELSSNKIIGIQEIKSYLQEKRSLKETKQIINQKTRQYAKRQFTWSRGHMKSWNKIYSSNMNDLYKKALNTIS